jgi:hypothetical protein
MAKRRESSFKGLKQLFIYIYIYIYIKSHELTIRDGRPTRDGN